METTTLETAVELQTEVLTPVEPAPEPWPKGFSVRLLPGATLPKAKSFRVSSKISMPKVPRTNPKPRIDKVATDTAARLYSVIDAAITRKGFDRTRVDRVNGKLVGSGRFYVALTDEHRALLLPADGEKREISGFDCTEEAGGYVNSAVLDNPELYCALERALVASDDRRMNKVTLEFGSVENCVRIAATDLESCSFDEDITLGAAAVIAKQETPEGEEPAAEKPVKIGFNGKYLGAVLGSWPLRIFWKDTESAIVFAPADDSFRYTLMPMRLERWEQ